MSVRGALSTMPAEDVLEWIARRKLSASITFERRGIVRSIGVEEGGVLWASSNRREEQLGVILVRSGLVPERALADALEARAETGVPLGKVLLMSGLIAEAELVEILATKIRESVTDVLTWTEGSFDIVPRTQSPATGVDAQLPIEICLTVARRRSSRMLDIMSLLGADDVAFYCPPHAQPPKSEDGQVIDLAKLWALAGDRHTASDMSATFTGERFATFDALARLVATNKLVVDRRHRERTNSAVELAAGARGRLRQGDRAGALAMASQALHQDPSDAEVRKTFTVVERARVAEIAKQMLARHHVPKRLKDGKALEKLAVEHALSAADLELAARVDGCWDLLSLVRASGVRDAEALLSFARLADAGVIELG